MPVLIGLTERQGGADWWLILILLGGFAVWAVTRSIRTYHRIETPTRLDSRINSWERELLGDDYRDKVAPYFHNKQEGRAARPADPQIRQEKSNVR